MGVPRIPGMNCMPMTTTAGVNVTKQGKRFSRYGIMKPE